MISKCSLTSRRPLQLIVLSYLIVPKPDSVVKEVEADDMIMERFAFGMPSWGGKALCKHLLHQLQMWLLIK